MRLLSGQIRCVSIYIFCALLMAGCVATSKYPRPPLIAPISLNAASEVANISISVVDHRVYYFSLRISFRENDQADRARVKRLVGEPDVKSSENSSVGRVPTPIQLVVYREDSGGHVEIYRTQVDPTLTSWGADHFKKQIGHHELRPGDYNLRLLALQAAPEFDGTPVAFSIGYDKFKASFKPQNK